MNPLVVVDAHEELISFKPPNTGRCSLKGVGRLAFADEATMGTNGARRKANDLVN